MSSLKIFHGAGGVPTWILSPVDVKFNFEVALSAGGVPVQITVPDGCDIVIINSATANVRSSINTAPPTLVADTAVASHATINSPGYAGLTGGMILFLSSSTVESVSLRFESGAY